MLLNEFFNHCHQATKALINYNMQGMNKTIPKIFTMLKATEVEIKKEHQVLMVNKTTSFMKRATKKGNFKKNGKKVAAPVKKPKAGPKPETECLHCKGNGHWKRNCPKIWRIRRMTK